jgi:F-box/leucine-rich repeat protein 2/20
MLRDLNLRGCRLLPEMDLIKIVESSPSLQRINLQGVQAVSPKVLNTIAEHTKNLQELNVSRSPLSIRDICDFIRLMSDDQARRLTSLRIAGLKSSGPEHEATDLFTLIAERLVSLETLDILGCTHIDDKDLAIFRTTHHEFGTVGPLRHLIMSNCTRLTSKSLASLAGFLPNMTKLELAGMPRMFTEDAQDGWNDKGFLDLLRSMPRLQKLDLEGTGIRGGVTDRMLDVLTPMRLPPTAGRKNSDDNAASAGQSRYAAGVGCELVELRIGYATRVTPEGLLRFIRGSPMLRVLEADVSVNAVPFMLLSDYSSPIPSRACQRSAR